ncbi:MAG: beta-1,6-N-acetylglucosaminyltransferase [Actinomycetota bacterium]
MKIAYLILAHKYPQQLFRLLQGLQTQQTSFFIHIDRKVENSTYYQIVEQLRGIENVHFLKRYPCFWGHFNLVKATLEGIRYIINLGVDFDYAVLLSGQDYLIKPTTYIEEFFTKHKGNQFLEFFPIHAPNKWTNNRDYYQAFKRICHWHFRFRSKHFYLPIQRNFPKGFEPYGGSQWWCLSRECLEYINTIVHQKSWPIDYFKYVLIPDEIFFQTLILNSPFKEQVINDDLRYTDWENPNPNVPATLVKTDFEKLAKSPKLFARKFDMNRDAEIFDLLDRQLLTPNPENC